MRSRLFDNEFLKKLEQLHIYTQRMLAGKLSGDRRSPKRGASVEFADYRNYTPGDDFRLIDWNAYARLEKLFLKMFVEEQDLIIHLFLDCSSSMACGEGRKERFARQVAGALAYLGLMSLEQVGVGGITTGLSHYLPPVRGREAVWKVWDFLESLPSGGQTDLNAALKGFARYRRRQGLAVVISDFLSPAGYREGLAYLQYLGQEVIVLQVLSPEELDPPLRGDLRLVDVETGEAEEISLTPQLLALYRKLLREYIDRLRNFCSSRNMTFLQLDSSMPLEDVILRSLPKVGVLG
ncbi:DUF58 domain-containing protein [Calderihabitans maritimus]|uniref:DUF58 domain-containing protein n=1 Tax=Calderihabitans maritimus TaxID=1246530 RepID=A0A1Z5HRI9_9FIRM|nr:DUF58 domain-containing protein [Calderihabitans maritimus]GAW91880.1 hypothetical protein Swol_1718 [Calderihabitans maritimus]